MDRAAALHRVRDSFPKQPVMTLIGAELAGVVEGAVSITLPANSRVLQQHGFVHGGIVTTIADSAAGYAAMTMVGLDMEVLTIELKTNFLRPAAGDLVAEGRVIRAGRQTVVTVADVYADPADARRHVAMLTATIAVVPHP